MKRCSQYMPFLLACLVVMTTVDRAAGQAKKPAKGKVDVIGAKITGTVAGIQGESILMTSVGNEKWIIQTNTREFRIKAKVTVEGKAVLEALRRGTYVRFTADMDKRGNIQGEVAELEIFTPSESAKPGMYANDGGEAREGRKPAVSNYLIAGQISSYHRGELTLVVPGSPGGNGVRGRVSEDAKVTFRGEDYRMARPGDKISAKGAYLPDQKGKLMAQEIAITLSRVLGETAESRKKKDRLAKRNAGKQPEEKEKTGDSPKDGKKPETPLAGPKAKPPAKADHDEPLILIIN